MIVTNNIGSVFPVLENSWFVYVFFSFLWFNKIVCESIEYLATAYRQKPKLDPPPKYIFRTDIKENMQQTKINEIGQRVWQNY